MAAAIAALKRVTAERNLAPTDGGRFLSEFMRVAALASADPDPFEAALAAAKRATTVPVKVSSSESGDTSNDFNVKSEKLCRGTKRSTGDPCRAYAMRDRFFCIYHEDDTVSGLSKIQESGRRSRRAAHAALGLDDLPFDLATRVGLNALTETVVRMELVGRLSDARSRRLLRYLRSLQLNIDHLDKEPEDADPKTYTAALAEALKAARVIAYRTETEEAQERARRLGDVGETRREYLRANREFGVNQPKLPPRNYSPSHPLSRHYLPPMPRL